MKQGYILTPECFTYIVCLHYVLIINEVIYSENGTIYKIKTGSHGVWGWYIDICLLSHKITEGARLRISPKKTVIEAS